MFAFGILTDKIAKDKEYLNSVEQLLGELVYNEIDHNNNTNPIMKSRACWLYGRYAPLIEWKN